MDKEKENEERQYNLYNIVITIIIGILITGTISLAGWFWEYSSNDKASKSYMTQRIDTVDFVNDGMKAKYILNSMTKTKGKNNKELLKLL